MNEKLKELVLTIDAIAGVTTNYKSFQEAVSQRIQQYADEQAVEFAQSLLADFEMVEDDEELKWQLCGTNQRYTTKEILLTRYHESQKP